MDSELQAFDQTPRLPFFFFRRHAWTHFTAARRGNNCAFGCTVLKRENRVVVLGSAELPDEMQAAYAMDIQACIVKPMEYSELRERIRILKEYWLDFDAPKA